MNEQVERLGSHIDGRLVLPADPDYDEARSIWNAMHDARPAAVVQAAGSADVVAALEAARATRLPIAVRGGGHSVAGNGTVEGGVVIDLGLMQAIEVDAAAATVRVGGGVTLGLLDRATEAHGLIVPVGVISGTGVAGLTLGGGVGWLSRAAGLTIDSLIEADVVLADGREVRVSASENSELFWGLRGGGGNFGIVTSFTFRALRLGPKVPTGTFVYRQPNWRSALRAFDGWTADLPPELTTIATFMTPLPEMEMGDETVLLVGFTWAGGDADACREAAEPMRAAAAPDDALIEPTRWVDWQSAADGLFPKGVRAYWKNAAMDALPAGAIDAIAEYAARLPSGRTGFDIHHLGGAVSAVRDAETAFPNRSARFWVNMYATWDEPADDELATRWTRDFHAALTPFAGAGEYVNFLGAEGGQLDARVAALAAYGEAKLARLGELKRRYDPDNIFRRNHNIPPA